jgi:putative hydrolase of HD superfamily
MLTLARLESFMTLLHAVQRVSRIARLPEEAAMRNTAEHTFELALLSWYIVTAEGLDLDLGKVLRYALAHDIIEGYSGDTPIFDEAAKKTKAAREAAALSRIETEFPDFHDLTETIHAYEAREDAESRFVYALDKLIDPLTASMETTQSIWKDMGMTYAQLREYKDAKIALSEAVEPFWKELCAKIEDKKNHFFDE